MARGVKLRAPPGTDEANFGTMRYPVKSDGSIWVPAATAEVLLKVGGFTLYDAPDEVPLPMGAVEMRGDPFAGASWRGESYTADADGLIVVPEAAVAILESHGFTVSRIGDAEPAAVVAAYSGSLPMGMAVLAGEPGSSISWGGHAFAADDKGMIIVPQAAVADMAAFGFAPAPIVAAPDPAPVETPIIEPIDPSPVEPVIEPAIALDTPAPIAPSPEPPVVEA